MVGVRLIFVFRYFLSLRQEHEQRLLMQESLDVYVKILSDMLEDTKDQEIKMSILAIRARLADMRKNFPSREQTLTTRLQELWALKVNHSHTTLARPCHRLAALLCG